MKALSGCFDRETGAPVTVDQLATYAEQLAQYHLQPESKFLNGDYLDRGTTIRRHIIVSDVELIGKEANRWEEQEHLGLVEDAEISYGIVSNSNAKLAKEIRTLADILGQRELADRLAWSRGRLAKLTAGKPVKLSRAEVDRVRRELPEILAEVEAISAAREKARAWLAELVNDMGLRPAARELGVDPSTLSQMTAGTRPLSRSVLDRRADAWTGLMVARTAAGHCRR